MGINSARIGMPILANVARNPPDWLIIRFLVEIDLFRFAKILKFFLNFFNFLTPITPFFENFFEVTPLGGIEKQLYHTN